MSMYVKYVLDVIIDALLGLVGRVNTPVVVGLWTVDSCLEPSFRGKAKARPSTARRRSFLCKIVKLVLRQRGARTRHLMPGRNTFLVFSELARQHLDG